MSTPDSSTWAAALAAMTDRQLLDSTVKFIAAYPCRSAAMLWCGLIRQELDSLVLELKALKDKAAKDSKAGAEDSTKVLGMLMRGMELAARMTSLTKEAALLEPTAETEPQAKKENGTCAQVGLAGSVGGQGLEGFSLRSQR